MKASELKAGDWFETTTRKGVRRGLCVESSDDCDEILAYLRGYSYDLQRMCEESVTPLPECTGWDWQPPTTKPYAVRQAEWVSANGIEVGSRVRVVRKAEDDEQGWNAGWHTKMTQLVGSMVLVDGIEAESIIIDDWCFPYFVLEPVVAPAAPPKDGLYEALKARSDEIMNTPAATQEQAVQVREGFYVASRASVPSRVAMWQDFRKRHNVISTWIDEAGDGETACLSELWSRIEREIRQCSALILYAEPGDFPLKGAYIEVGMALAIGKPVRVVCPKVSLDARSLRPLGSWARHPLVTFHESIESAAIASVPPTEQPGEAKAPEPDTAPLMIEPDVAAVETPSLACPNVDVDYGYRRLQLGETVEATDEFTYDFDDRPEKPSWRQVSPLWVGNKIDDYFVPVRRRVAPQPEPVSGPAIERLQREALAEHARGETGDFPEPQPEPTSVFDEIASMLERMASESHAKFNQKTELYRYWQGSRNAYRLAAKAVRDMTPCGVKTSESEGR